MFFLTIKNASQATRHQHDEGPLLVGRSPATKDPHVVVHDEYVSRRHLRLHETSAGRVHLENLGRHDLRLRDGSRLATGEQAELEMPAEIRIVNTTIVVSPASEPDGGEYKTISLPASRHTSPRGLTTLVKLGRAPSPETLAVWFETLISVQKSAAGSTEFYHETAQAVVDLVGLDRGMVIMVTSPPDDWKIVASCTKGPQRSLPYSTSVLTKVAHEQRTFYGNPQRDKMSNRDSLANLEAVVASPIFDETGSVVGILYGSRDFENDLSQFIIDPLEAQVMQLLASSISAGLARMRIEEKMKQVEQMAAVGQALGYIMHDLRGPIGNAQNLSQMLREGDEDLVSADEQFEMLEECLENSLSLLNDSIEFCRGKARVEPQRGDCGELLARHLRLLEMNLKGRGVRLETEIPAGLIVELDPDRIARVIYNLAYNAAAALEGQADGVVRMGARGTSSNTELWVADNAGGIPEQVLERLFQPFATHGKRGGTGFGLAIAKQLVEAHSGTIQVSTGKAGTEFLISLPNRTEQQRRQGGNRDTAGSATHFDETWTANKRILVADDTAVNQRLISSLLERLGHQVTVVDDGQAALDAIRQQPFDLVLMDLHMPVMGGIDAARTIRSQSPVPIVALTAEHTELSRQQCLDAGMSDCLQKPVSAEDLEYAVKQFCP